MRPLALLVPLVLATGWPLSRCQDALVQLPADIAAFNCQLNLDPLPDTYIKFSAFSLKFKKSLGFSNYDGRTTVRQQKLREEDEPLEFESIDYKGSNLSSLSSLDLNSPFVIFTNGFNHKGAVNGSWMGQAAKTLMGAHLDTKRPAGHLNAIFLPWFVEGLATDNLLSMPLAYYSTMANYRLLVNELAKAIVSLVDLVETGRRRPASNSSSSSLTTRSHHYAQWRIYGHSLGAHLASEALVLVHRLRPWVKFGQLLGLDPAQPCFLDDHHGLSALRLAESVGQVSVVHTNAAFSGVNTRRTDADIVLNGGTFQPACAWYDFGCSHVRATEILGYRDAHCEMVAYRCTTHQQFKLGACPSCDRLRGSDLSRTLEGGCLLVNMPEQHPQSDELSSLTDQVPRQIADSELPGQPQRLAVERDSGQGRGHRFYAKTDPNFARRPDKSHCLQLYQLRLLRLDQEMVPLAGKTSCPLGSFLARGLSGPQVQLFAELPLQRQNVRHKRVDDSIGTMGTNRGSGDPLLKPMMLNTIVEDKVYTGLLNFGGQAKLFVGAIIEGIDLASLANCLLAKSASKMSFVLDIAFMSSTKQTVRQAHSSILCGQLDPFSVSTVERSDCLQNDKGKCLGEDNNRTSEAGACLGTLDRDFNYGGLIMGLCKQSDLMNVSKIIDGFLDDSTINHHYESWQISLLNNLFNLYSNWEPFK